MRPHLRGFDFDGALQLGSAAHEFQQAVLRDATNLQSSRDQMLDAWKGPFGDYLRERADDNDRRLQQRMEGLDRRSERWVKKWVNQVDRVNLRSWQIAMAEHREFLASLHRPTVFELPVSHQPAQSGENGHRRYRRRFWGPGTEPVLPVDLDGPARPRPTARPANFRPSEPPFVHYRQQGLRWHVSYHDDPPLQLGYMPLDPGDFVGYHFDSAELIETPAEEADHEPPRITPINAILDRGIDAEMFITEPGRGALELSIDLKLVRRYLRVSREFSQRWFPELEKLSQTWWAFERSNSVSVPSPKWFRTFNVFNRIRRTRIFVRTIHRLLKGVVPQDPVLDVPWVVQPIELPTFINAPSPHITGEMPLETGVSNPNVPDEMAPPVLIDDSLVEGVEMSPGTTGADAGDSQVLANGTTVVADGTQVLPDGTTVLPDGTLVLPDGTTVLPDGTQVLPDGSVQVPPPVVPMPAAPTANPQETYGFGPEPIVAAPVPVPPPPVAGPPSPQSATPHPPTTNESPFQQITPPPPLPTTPSFQGHLPPSTPPIVIDNSNAFDGPPATFADDFFGIIGLLDTPI